MSARKCARDAASIRKRSGQTALRLGQLPPEHPRMAYATTAKEKAGGRTKSSNSFALENLLRNPNAAKPMKNEDPGVVKQEEASCAEAYIKYGARRERGDGSVRIARRERKGRTTK